MDLFSGFYEDSKPHIQQLGCFLTKTQSHTYNSWLFSYYYYFTISVLVNGIKQRSHIDLGLLWQIVLQK